MVAGDEGCDGRLGIGLPVVGTDRRIQGDQRGGTLGAAHPMNLHVLGIGQQLFQQDDMAKRIAGELVNDVLDSRGPFASSTFQ